MHLTIISPFDPHPPNTANGNGHTGGVERVLSNFAHHVADRGHNVSVICSTDGSSGNGGSNGHAQVNGHQVVRVPRAGTLFRAPIVDLTKYIPEHTDLVHVPATYPFTTPRVLGWANKAQTPAVLDFHFEPHPGSALGRLAAKAYRSIGPRTYDHADAVLVRSLAYGRNAPSLSSVPEDRWHALPNGIDPGRFCPNGAGGHGDHLLFVGRLVPYKGVDVLLDALAEHDVGHPLKIAGGGPLREHLEAKADRLDLDVTFLGHVAEERLPGLYRDAVATVLPSVNQQECFGVTLVESMACGTPVVASDLPGVSEVAQHGGLVARPGDPASLATQLSRIADDPGIPRGEKLAAQIHEEFSWDTLTDRLLGVYENVLDT